MANQNPPTPPQHHAKHPANRLATSTSPYLLQHAHNPVDWYPWGEEAFDAARERQVPIFLSVGYATCYWCHVMERESFENPLIGRLLSEHFVCIKVDREQRPDIDDIYMNAVQLMTESGGWPMSAWLTPPGARSENDPGLEPFYAGTYFPPTPAFNRPSLKQVAEGISQAWHDRRDQVLQQAAQLTAAIRANLASEYDPVRINETQIAEAIGSLLQMHDQDQGGFSGAPKFPQPAYLEFLLECAASIDDPAARSAALRSVRHTLDRMAIGGIHDQVGSGFHRYSVDEHWLVPHFEKMLYDNAQLASVYARSFSQSHDPLDAMICRRTLDYALTEMRDEQAGFHSAQDAEVNAREGLNYLWTPEEVRTVITEAINEHAAEFALRVYGLDHPANFRDPHHPDEPPRWVLRLDRRPDAMAQAMKMDHDTFMQRLYAVNEALYAARAKRQQPAKDDKVITAWNGLMIAALADGAMALHDAAYLDAAKATADFILNNMRNQQGDLLRIWRAGQASTAAVLEDYAFLIQGLLALHRASASFKDPAPRALAAAEELFARAERLFSDELNVLHDTPANQHDLIVRARSAYDGAIPAAASVMLHNAIDLFLVSRETAYIQAAVNQLAALSREIRRSPIAAINSTRALHRLLTIDPAIIEALPEDNSQTSDRITRDFDPADPVAVLASTDRVSVAASKPATLRLRLEIKPGYHINAHDPGVEGVVGMNLRIAEGTGVRVSAAYPLGVLLEHASTTAAGLRVHHAQVEFTVELHRTDEPWTGRPLLLLEYQACTDAACLPPRLVELDVAIDPAA